MIPETPMTPEYLLVMNATAQQRSALAGWRGLTGEEVYRLRAWEGQLLLQRARELVALTGGGV